MICLVIRGPTYHDVIGQIEKAIPVADMIELNLDKWEKWDLDFLRRLRTQYKVAMLFTLRQKEQGGDYSQSEEKRLEDLEALATLLPEYLDVEDSVPKEFVNKLRQKHPQIKLLLSHHNFTETPLNLDALLSNMKRTKATIYKIACKANSSIDAMRMLSFLKKHNQEPLVGISMGEHGEATRVAGKLFGSQITYAMVEEGISTAPGQLVGSFIKENYHYASLTQTTGLYGLIGNPVSKSLSHITHNHVMHDMQLNGVYVKVPVHPDDLPEFMPYLKSLQWKGLSVTMPLKEKIIPLLDEIDPIAKEIGAVNTLVFRNGKCHGYNTDGIGALKAIEEKLSVAGKRVVMIGAGGAAKAVVYMLHKKGAHVTVLNRNKERAVALAQQVGCQGDGLEGIEREFQLGYDLIINSTPVEMPIDSRWILPGKAAMDLKTRPKETEFLRHAKAKGCDTIYGISMFYHQAVEQFKLWFGDSIDQNAVLHQLERAGNKHV